MKDFSAKNAEHMTFTLGGKKKYSIPLASSMPMRYARRMTAAAQMDEATAATTMLEIELDILTEYLGADVADNLTTTQVGDIFSAWSEENTKAGIDSGE